MEAGVSGNTVLELVELSDLARIPGVQGIRARLYHDAGIKSVESMAEWEPEELREMVADFILRSGFDGIAPLSAEARFTIDKARSLPKVLDC